MKYLLDTQLLLWAAGSPERLSREATAIISDDTTELYVSVASIWEVAIKASLRRTDFSADPHVLRQALLSAGYTELAISGEDAAAVGDLEPIHRDPFDRLLIAQARRAGLVLLTSEVTLARYSGSIELV